MNHLKKKIKMCFCGKNESAHTMQNRLDAVEEDGGCQKVAEFWCSWYDFSCFGEHLRKLVCGPEDHSGEDKPQNCGRQEGDDDWEFRCLRVSSPELVRHPNTAKTWTGSWVLQRIPVMRKKVHCMKRTLTLQQHWSLKQPLRSRLADSCCQKFTNCSRRASFRGRISIHEYTLETRQTINQQE